LNHRPRPYQGRALSADTPTAHAARLPSGRPVIRRYPLGISTWIVPDDTEGGSSLLGPSCWAHRRLRNVYRKQSETIAVFSQQPFAIQLAPQEELVGIDGVPLSYPCYPMRQVQRSPEPFCASLRPSDAFSSALFQLLLDLKCPLIPRCFIAVTVACTYIRTGAKNHSGKTSDRRQSESWRIPLNTSGFPLPIW
jgi:hypothetical protein